MWKAKVRARNRRLSLLVSSTFLPSLGLGWWGTILRRLGRANAGLVLAWSGSDQGLCSQRPGLRTDLTQKLAWLPCPGSVGVQTASSLLLQESPLVQGTWRQRWPTLPSRESTPANYSTPCGPLLCQSHSPLRSQGGMGAGQLMCFIDCVHLLVVN